MPFDDDQFALLEAVGHDDVATCSTPVVIRRSSTFFAVVDHEHVAAGLVESGWRTAEPPARAAAAPRSTSDADNPAGDQQTAPGSATRARTATVSVVGSTWTSRKS